METWTSINDNSRTMKIHKWNKIEQRMKY